MLILDDPATWPDHIIKRLQQEKVVQLLKQSNFIDDLVRHPTLRPVLEEVEAYVEANPLTAYHCTKQLPERPFAATGLRVLNFGEHHDEIKNLLRNHRLVTPALFDKLTNNLDFWKKNHTGIRENMLWFCVDRSLVFNEGTTSFFKFFGGEAVYFAMMDDSELGPILQRLGEPVVVEARIASRDLTVFQDFAFARSLVSHFAASVNPEFKIENREGFLSKGVKPIDVVAVHPYKNFVQKYARKQKNFV